MKCSLSIAVVAFFNKPSAASPCKDKRNGYSPRLRLSDRASVPNNTVVPDQRHHTQNNVDVAGVITTIIITITSVFGNVSLRSLL